MFLAVVKFKGYIARKAKNINVIAKLGTTVLETRDKNEGK